MSKMSTFRMPRVNGRRGAVQILCSVVYFFVGVSFITAPAASSRTAALGYLADLGIPLAPLAALWILSAALAVVSAFYSRPKDAVGFTALVIARPGFGEPSS
jgi:hypothetical protein